MNRKRQSRSATAVLPGAERAQSEHLPRHGRQKHGHYLLQRTLEEATERSLQVFPQDTPAGREYQRKRRGFIDALGGEETVSPQLDEIIDEVLMLELLIRNINAYLVELGPKIVNRRYKRLAPICLQRQQLADSRLRHLQALGLERRARSLPRALEYASGATAEGGST